MDLLILRYTFTYCILILGLILIMGIDFGVGFSGVFLNKNYTPKFNSSPPEVQQLLGKGSFWDDAE